MSRIELCDVCKHIVSTKHESLTAFPPVHNISWALIIKFTQWLVIPQISVAVCCSWCCFWRVKLQPSQEMITPIAPQSVLHPQSIVITSTTASMQGQTRKLKRFFKKWRNHTLNYKMTSTSSKGIRRLWRVKSLCFSVQTWIPQKNFWGLLATTMKTIIFVLLFLFSFAWQFYFLLFGGIHKLKTV